MYSKATYTSTFTVLKQSSSYSYIVLELCGSKQGGKLSAQDFLCYNSSWSRMIAAAKIGLQIGGQKLGGFVCADDSLSCTSTLGEMLSMALIYQYYSFTFDVAYAFAKTILNVFNNPELKSLIMKENIFRLGGVPPLYDESSVHLGLIMTEDIDKTEEMNVENRLDKTEKKIFMTKCPNIISML